MGRKRKWVSVILVMAVMFLGYTARIYGVSNDITRSEAESPNTQANRKSITEKVLMSTGRSAMFKPEEARNVTIYPADLLGDEKNEIVVAVEFDKRNTIVAVYTPEGNNYKYVGDVGEFFYIENIQFLPITSLNGKNIILIREYANQNIGAFERSSFIKGYAWDTEEGEFRQVLNTPEGIEAIWNELWDGATKDGQSRWNRIQQRSDITFSGDGTPILDSVHTQSHSISSDVTSKEPPNPATYDTINNRVVSESLRWNNEWQRFILSEKIDNNTSEKVAVIEDFGASPYALLAQYKDNANMVRIERKSGLTEIVNKNTLSDIDGSATTNAFIAF